MQGRQVDLLAPQAASRFDSNRTPVHSNAMTPETLDHFVMVRIHARQPANAGADPLAICSVQKPDTKSAVIWLLSGFEVLLTLPSSICADLSARFALAKPEQIVQIWRALRGFSIMEKWIRFMAPVHPQSATALMRVIDNHLSAGA
jgi:hypothetical protein